MTTIGQVLSITSIGVTFGAPVLLMVWRRHFFAMSLGAVVVWLTPCIFASLIQRVDPDYHPGIQYAAWLAGVGLLFGCVYVLLLYGLKRLILRCVRVWRNGATQR
jgi:hypothetical protein